MCQFLFAAIRCSILLTSVLACVYTAVHITRADEPIKYQPVKGGTDTVSVEVDEEVSQPGTVEEARSRAKLLFEMANGSLQVMHRDFFDEDKSHAIPSASLENVFQEMKKSFGVEMKWLNAGTDVVNTDHQPQGEFETNAAQAIKRGSQAVEELSKGEYRFAGAITLRSQCLKCHIKDRKSTEDRFAGLVIRMPVKH